MKTKGRVTAIDRYVGQRIREARHMQKLSQEKVSEKLDITYQQLQKFEVGKNRVSTGRLAHLSKILERPIEWFYPEEYWNGSAVNKRVEIENQDLKTRMAWIGARAKEIYQVTTGEEL